MANIKPAAPNLSRFCQVFVSVRIQPKAETYPTVLLWYKDADSVNNDLKDGLNL